MAVDTRYIVVEGPIGVGKTTLAHRIAERLGMEVLSERAEENPFLEGFYRNPEKMAFQAQLYFLMQRSEQLRELRQRDLFRPGLIADFSFHKDRLFASLNLSDAEFDLYDRVYRTLELEVPTPDLVVYLQAPVDVLLERIRRRRLPFEQGIGTEYLQRLAEAYVDFFYHYDDSPLLIVNAADINPAERDRDLDVLMEQIEAVRTGRHYFNPTPLAL